MKEENLIETTFMDLMDLVMTHVQNVNRLFLLELYMSSVKIIRIFDFSMKKQVSDFIDLIRSMDC